MDRERAALMASDRAGGPAWGALSSVIAIGLGLVAGGDDQG